MKYNSFISQEFTICYVTTINSYCRSLFTLLTAGFLLQCFFCRSQISFSRDSPSPPQKKTKTRMRGHTYVCVYIGTRKSSLTICEVNPVLYFVTNWGFGPLANGEIVQREDFRSKSAFITITLQILVSMLVTVQLWHSMQLT